MSHTPHELAEEFPDQADKIHVLKGKDAHFAWLAEAYHAVNRAVHRSETRIDTLSNDEEEALRRERAQLKDHIWQHLRKA